MSQQTSGHPPVSGTGPRRVVGSPETAQVARDQAADVGRTTADAGSHVADTAPDQAGEVGGEASARPAT